MSLIQIEAAGQETLEQMQKLLAGFPSGVEKASRSAMSRAVSHLRTNSAKAIRERYDISAANVKADENVTVRYSIQNGVQATVAFAGRKFTLYKHGGASPGMPVSGVPARGHQMKSTSPAVFHGAFVARMSSGHVGIFERTGGMTSAGKEQIQELMGSSVPQMLGSPAVAEKLSKEAMEKFEDRLKHEINAILNGWR